jgi:hypothetical protein
MAGACVYSCRRGSSRVHCVWCRSDLKVLPFRCRGALLLSSASPCHNHDELQQPYPHLCPAALPASMFFAHAHDLLQQTTELSAKKQTKESSRPKSPSQIVISEHLPPNLDLRKDQQGPEILYSLHSLLLFLVTIDFLI